MINMKLINFAQAILPHSISQFVTLIRDLCKYDSEDDGYEKSNNK